MAVTVLVSLYVHLSVLLCLKNAVLLNPTNTPWSYNLSTTLLLYLWSLTEGLSYIHPINFDDSKVANSLHIVLLLNVLITKLSTERKAYLIWLNNGHIYGIIPPRVILLSRIRVIGFHLGHYLVTYLIASS